jgi:hypothetical protein
MGLLYKLTLWSCVCWGGGGRREREGEREGFWIQWFHDQDATIPNEWPL